VAGDDRALLDALDRAAENGLRGSRGDHVEVVARDRVAEQRVAESVDVEDDGCRKPREERALLGAETVPHPAELGRRRRRLGEGVRPVRPQRAVAVAPHPVELGPGGPEQRKRLDRLGAEGDVAPDHDRVDTGRVDVGEHGAQRVGHAVDVVERGDAH
jgi:hypothetical protein